MVQAQNYTVRPALVHWYASSIITASAPDHITFCHPSLVSVILSLVRMPNVQHILNYIIRAYLYVWLCM